MCPETLRGVAVFASGGPNWFARKRLGVRENARENAFCRQNFGVYGSVSTFWVARVFKKAHI